MNNKDDAPRKPGNIFPHGDFDIPDFSLPDAEIQKPIVKSVVKKTNPIQAS